MDSTKTKMYCPICEKYYFEELLTHAEIRRRRLRGEPLIPAMCPKGHALMRVA